MKERIQSDLKYFTKILEDKGYALTEKSPNQSDIQKIEHPPKGAKYDAQKLFDLFSSQPLCRLIFQFMLIESIDKGNKFTDIDKFTNFIYGVVRENKIQHAIAEPPVHIFVCPECKNSNYVEVKRADKIRVECQSCGAVFDRKKRKKIGTWQKVGLFDVYRVLSQLSETGFVLEQNQIICYECEKIEISPTTKMEEHIKCKKCGNFKEIKKVYSTIDFSSFRDIKATWFEWYVYKILKEKCENVQHVIPPHKVKNMQTGQETEVDVLAITKNNKIISIDCKAKFLRSSVSRDDINSNVLGWMQFTDYLIIIATTEIPVHTKEFWKDNLNACETLFIHGNEIEKLPEILNGV
jgi:Fe2+ or Zn2+ uptake regulation protein